MRRGQDGFTLAEMLVVLAILALTAVLSFPASRQSAEGQVFNTFGQSLAGLLREARITAISQNHETSVTLDFETRTAAGDGKSRVLAIPANVSVAAITARGDVSEGRATFRFFADGGATGGEIKLRNGKTVRLIAINWLTGAITMHAGDAL